MKYFKPNRSVAEVESLINRLLQKPNEGVDEFSKRAFLLKADYELEVKAERQANSFEMDEAKIREMENKVASSFINGLKDHIFRCIREKPATLVEALTLALEAESTANVRYENRKVSERFSDQKKRNEKGGNKPVKKALETESISNVRYENRKISEKKL